MEQASNPEQKRDNACLCPSINSGASNRLFLISLFLITEENVLESSRNRKIKKRKKKRKKERDRERMRVGESESEIQNELEKEKEKKGR